MIAILNRAALYLHAVSSLPCKVLRHFRAIYFLSQRAAPITVRLAPQVHLATTAKSLCGKARRLHSSSSLSYEAESTLLMFPECVSSSLVPVLVWCR